MLAEKKILENGGIDPPTSHMLSERSTIWANSPAVLTYYILVSDLLNIEGVGQFLE